ncbi:MAG: lipase family protein [Chitinispirillaceae bacterium]
MYYPAGFDRSRAVQLAELVKQAYDQLEAFKKNEEWGLRGDYSLMTGLFYLGAQAAQSKAVTSHFDKELHQFVKSKFQKGTGLPIGFIACSGSDVFLVFRGTMTVSEWLNDYSVSLTPYPYGAFGNVHNGFIKTYGIFRKTILDALRNIGPEKRLYIAGHSLGAALATLAVPDIASSTVFASASVYTYASPRVGDRTFAAEYNRLTKGRSFRIANTCDLVGSIPFPVPFLGIIGAYFTHVDDPVEFTVQEEDVDKNHDVETYLKALKADEGRSEGTTEGKRGLFRRMFARFNSGP